MNTVKAYKNHNGQIILDCGTHYGQPVLVGNQA